jgi:ferredoxin-type protein NapG
MAVSFATVLGVTGLVDIAPHRDLVRPPGAISEDRFVENCLRCGACVDTCPVQGIEFARLADGLRNVGTPIVTGYCMVYHGLDDPSPQKVMAWKADARAHGLEVRCYDCVNVCPSGALQQVDASHLRLGVAVVRRDHCLAWLNSTCGFPCVKVCPFDAISIGAGPVVDVTKCVGCSICDFACLARETTGVTGIMVQPVPA